MRQVGVKVIITLDKEENVRKINEFEINIFNKSSPIEISPFLHQK